MSIAKTASGWVSDKLPGRFFQTRTAAMVALAWNDVMQLLSDKA